MPRNRHHHYLTVVSTGPLVILRTPWPTPKPWRAFAQKVVTMMRVEHKVKRAEVFAIEAFLASPDEQWRGEDCERAAKLDAAFAGDASVMLDFGLYDFVDGEVKKVRGVPCS